MTSIRGMVLLPHNLERGFLLGVVVLVVLVLHSFRVAVVQLAKTFVALPRSLTRRANARLVVDARVALPLRLRSCRCGSGAFRWTRSGCGLSCLSLRITEGDGGSLVTPIHHDFGPHYESKGRLRKQGEATKKLAGVSESRCGHFW